MFSMRSTLLSFLSSILVLDLQGPLPSPTFFSYHPPLELTSSSLSYFHVFFFFPFSCLLFLFSLLFKMSFFSEIDRTISFPSPNLRILLLPKTLFFVTKLFFLSSASLFFDLFFLLFNPPFHCSTPSSLKPLRGSHLSGTPTQSFPRGMCAFFSFQSSHPMSRNLPIAHPQPTGNSFFLWNPGRWPTKWRSPFQVSFFSFLLFSLSLSAIVSFGVPLPSPIYAFFHLRFFSSVYITFYLRGRILRALPFGTFPLIRFLLLDCQTI